VTGQSGAAYSILLVEDDSLSLKLMRDVLEASGYEVVQATNGLDGLAMAQENQPNLLVVDIGLPGMDGVEVTRSLKQDASLGHIPVLAVSAYAMHQDETRMRDAGCDGFMSKPLRFADFVAEVGRLLDARVS
jgi:two-component system cell cycle response regulator DivK